MDNQQSPSGLFVFLLVVLAVAVGALGVLTMRPAPTDFGAPADQVFLDSPAGEMPTESLVHVAPGTVGTQVVATNTARVYLEITNAATSSLGQALWCSTNDRRPTIGQGMVIFASSTRVITNLSGAIRCRYQTATSGVATLEK